MSATPSTHARTRLAANLAVAAVFGLFFAYDVFESVGNLVWLTAYANDLRVGILGWGWIVLIGAIVLPAALWVAATWLGWARPLRQKLGLQLLALTVSASSYLCIITMFNDTNLFELH